MKNIRLDERGLVPAVAQNANSGEVIMLGYVSPGSLRRTLEGGDVWFYSRSRSDLWHKGETSGNYMKLRAASMDCDGDTLLLQVDPEGPICHTGRPTCFFTAVDDLPDFETAETGAAIIDELFATIQDRRRERPDGSYTAKLLDAGIDRISQKVIEEAGEMAIAAVRGGRAQTVSEAADVLYHVLVLLAASGAAPEGVWEELRKRRK